MDGSCAAAQVDASRRLGAAFTFTRALENPGPNLELTEESAARGRSYLLMPQDEREEIAAAAEAMAGGLARAAEHGCETS